MSAPSEAIHIALTKSQISDLIYQQLEDAERDADAVHARHAISFAIDALDQLGLLVREARA